ncbi:MAG: glycoside hydrolase family 2 protein [Vicinamibacteraceae bacterium]
MLRRAGVFALMAVLVQLVCAAERARIDLNGTWELRLDPRNRGETEGWQTIDVPFEQSIDVPGAWQAQGVGQRSGSLRHDYTGAAWYRKRVAIPATWKGKVVRLRIGGAHRYTALFVNGVRIGEHRGFSAPFQFDVTGHLRPGADNVIVLRISNPGSVPTLSPREQRGDRPTGMLNYLGNWGGIYGHVELQASEPTWIEDVYVRPDIERGVARFRVTVRSREAEAYPAELRVLVSPSHESRTSLRISRGDDTVVDVEVPIPNARLWSPEHPHLYEAAVTLWRGETEYDRLDERFGMREVSTDGNVLLLNGKPLYLRGYGDDNIEVLTGFPPASREVYLKRLRLARSFGFNAVRFHSMTPAEELFHAADEVGILVMAELPVAYTQYFLPHRDLLRGELERIVRTFRNRPSFLSIALGNELNEDWLETDAEKKRLQDTVAQLYHVAKKLHPDGLVLSNDGYIVRPTDMVSHFDDGLPDLPTIKHEFGGYYCSLPDISLIDRFTGVLLPTWLDAKKRWVHERDLTEQYPLYLRHSQRLQQLGRKAQIENVRRQAHITGYHYWLIVDFPGGTGEGDSWEEGWFDYFWRPKGISPSEGREINAPVLPLVGADVDDRTLWRDSTKTIGVTVSNYGSDDLRGAQLSWKLLADDEVVVQEGDVRIDVPMGSVAEVAEIAVRPPPGNEAQAFELEVAINGRHLNRWTLWAFPRDARLPQPEIPVYSTVKWAGIERFYPFVRRDAPDEDAEGLLVTSALDEDTLRFLRAGGRVWLLADSDQFAPRAGAGFFPEAGGALGTLVRDHPAVDGFPHEGVCDLQFYNLLEGAVPFPLDDWPKEFQPIIGGIRTTASFLSKTKNLSHVGYLFEARVGAGRLLVTTLRLRQHLDEAYPEAVHLFDRLLRYATGHRFAPAHAVDVEQLAPLMSR